MSDENTPSEHQWTRLLAELQRSNQIWGGVARSVANGGGGGGGLGGGGSFNEFMQGLKKYNDEQQSTATQQRRSVNETLDGARSGFNRSVDNVSGKLKLLGEGSEGALSALKGLARGSFFAAIVSQLVDAGTAMLGNYRKMNDAGQGFTGGMMDMGKAAAVGGVTVDELVRVTQKNSAAMARLGGPEGFLGLATGVRDNIRKYGMLGMTVSQVNDMVGDYTETMRVQGRLEGTSRGEAARQISDLAKNASILSQAFGTSREQIMKQTMAAQQDDGVVAYRETLSNDMKKQFDDMMGFITPQFAALGGKAGDFMTKLATQVGGHLDNPGMINSGPAKDLMDRGLGGQVFKLGQLMDRVAKAPTEANKKALADFQVMLGNAIGQLAPSLRLMDATGQQLAALGPQLRQVITAKQNEDASARALMEDAKASLTRSAASLEEAWLTSTGKMRAGFYDTLAEGLKSASDAFESVSKSGGLDRLKNSLTEAGGAILNLFGKNDWHDLIGSAVRFVASDVQDFANHLKELANDLNWFKDQVVKIATLFGAIGTKRDQDQARVDTHQAIRDTLPDWVTSVMPALTTRTQELAQTVANLQKTADDATAKQIQLGQDRTRIQKEFDDALASRDSRLIAQKNAELINKEQEIRQGDIRLRETTRSLDVNRLAQQEESLENARELLNQQLKGAQAAGSGVNEAGIKNIQEALAKNGSDLSVVQKSMETEMGNYKDFYRKQQQDNAMLQNEMRQRRIQAPEMLRQMQPPAQQGSGIMDSINKGMSAIGDFLIGKAGASENSMLQREMNIAKEASQGDSQVAQAMTANAQALHSNTRAMGNLVETSSSSSNRVEQAISADRGGSAAPVANAMSNLDSQLAGATDEINTGNARVSALLGQVIQSLENQRKDGRDQTDVIAMLLNLLRKDTRDNGAEIRRSGD